MSSVAELEQRVLQCAADVHAAQAALAEALAEFDAAGGWQGAGIRSVGHWADINLGIPSRTATTVAAVGARLTELPALREAFESGAVSADKATMVARVATQGTDDRFTALARAASVAQLRRICSAYRDVTADDTPEIAAERHARRSVTSATTDDGLVRIVALLEPDDAALVLAALDARVEAAWRSNSPDPDLGPAPDLATRRADALVELASEGLVTGPDPIVRGERIEVRVIVDADNMSDLDGIGPLPAATVERLLCDCTIRPGVRRPDGSLDLGRSQRTVNRRQRRALQFRDKGCRFPGCPNRRFVDAHHVIAWDANGPTDMDNLVLLCPEHHRLFHEGSYRIDPHGQGRFTFHRPDGRPIQPPPLQARPDAKPAPGSPTAQGHGDRYDLGLTLDALGP